MGTALTNSSSPFITLRKEEKWKSKNRTHRGRKKGDLKSAGNSSLLVSVTVLPIRGPNSVITPVSVTVIDASAVLQH